MASAALGVIPGSIQSIVAGATGAVKLQVREGARLVFELPSAPRRSWTSSRSATPAQNATG
jgi:hypothetical protein